MTMFLYLKILRYQRAIITVLMMLLFTFTSGEVNALDIGQVPPDFELVDTEGHDVSLGDFQDQNVLLVLGTTGCSHCENILPVLEVLSESISSEDLQIIYIIINLIYIECIRTKTYCAI